MAELRLKIQGMTCASCSARVEKALGAVPGVSEAMVNLATSEARVVGSGHLPLLGLLEAAHRVGYEAQPIIDGAESEPAPSSRQDRDDPGRDLILSAALTAPLAVLSMLLPPSLISGLAQALLSGLVLLFPGRGFFVRAWRMLVNRHTAMETLIALGASAAWLSSAAALIVGGHLYFETVGMIITLILLGHTLELRAKRKAAEALRNLSALLPSAAIVVDDDGQERELPLGEVQSGDRLRVRSGSQIPADGIVLKGEGALDESVLTGESRSIRRAEGDGVTAGTLLQDGFIEIRVTATGEKSILAGILRLVSDAQASKAPVQRLADRVAGIFVPVVIGIAGLTLLLGFLLSPEAGAVTLILRSVAVLVIACPCALGLATPTAILVGSGTASRHGILFRDAEALERLHSIGVLAMDKTGTLTRGRPRVVRFQPFAVDPGDKIFSLVAAAESAVEHPLARALVSYCREREETASFALSVVSRAGAGVRAEVGGRQVRVGSAWYLESEGLDLESAASALDEVEEQGLTPVLVALDDRLAGLFALEDELRVEVPALIASLKRLDIKPILLTGDRSEAARRAARQAGIDDLHAGLLPEDKAKRIRGLAATSGPVAMLGDGVNDAPALAAADIGIALSSGADLAVASAPVTLLGGDLSRVLDAIALSRRTLSTIRQNLFWAFFYNLLAIPLAATGVLNPMIAAGAMAASSIFVVTNSLRLRGFGFMGGRKAGT